MRNKNRIDEILDMIRIIWKQYPDWKFCQLYVNLFGGGDNFYVEDDVVKEALKLALETWI